MGFLVFIFIVIIVLGIILALCYKFPFLKWVIPVVAGITVCILGWAWWGGLIVCAILFAIIDKMTQTVVSHGGARYQIWCNKCGSDNVEVTRREGKMVFYRCNNCGEDKECTYLN